MPVAFDDREQRVGRGRIAQLLPLQQPHASIAEQVRRALEADRVVEAAVVLGQLGDRRIEIVRDVGHAVLLQPPQRPDDAGGAHVERGDRQRAGLVDPIARVHRPQGLRIEGRAGRRGDAFDRGARCALAPGLAAECLVPIRG